MNEIENALKLERRRSANFERELEQLNFTSSNNLKEIEDSLLISTEELTYYKSECERTSKRISDIIKEYEQKIEAQILQITELRKRYLSI